MPLARPELSRQSPGTGIRFHAASSKPGFSRPSFPCIRSNLGLASTARMIWEYLKRRDAVGFENTSLPSASIHDVRFVYWNDANFPACPGSVSSVRAGIQASAREPL